MDWPAPNFWLRSRCRRSTVDSSFCAATVPSHDSRRGQAGVAVAAGGSPVLAEVGQQLHAAALRPSRRAPASRRGARPASRRCARSPSERVDHLALLHDVLQPVGQPGGRRQAVAPGAAGLLVVALDRLRQVEVGDEAHVGLVDAHAERDRGDHDQAVLAQEAGLVARRGSARRDRRGTAGPGCRWPPGTRRSSPPTRGTGSRRCRRRRGARCAAGRAAAGAARSSARSGTGCWAGRSWPRSAGRSVEVAAGWRSRRGWPSVAVAVSAIRGTSGQRSCSIDRRQVVGPEVVAPLRHAVRLVDREQRDLCRGRAAAASSRHAEPLGREVEQVELAGEERRLDRAAARRSPAWS